MEESMHPIVDDPRGFLFAGDCLFTVVNEKTGKRFTYKLQEPKEQRNPQDPVYFLSLLTGPDNHRDYDTIGMIFSGVKYVHWRKCRFGADSPGEVAFVWLLARLLGGGLPDCVRLYHHSYCAKCGKLLTVDESIKRGLGPDCAARVFGG